MEKDNKKNKALKKKLEEKRKKKWLYIVTISTFFSTIFITYISDVLLSYTPLLLSFVILVVIIVFGVGSDIVGVAITAASIKPFNSMAAQKVFGAKTAVKIVQNAPKYSNICSDVIGDICGIVSGATGVAITTQFLLYFPTINAVVLSLCMSGFIAAFTVGGKALGKEYAVKNSIKIITLVSKVIATFNKIFHF